MAVADPQGQDFVRRSVEEYLESLVAPEVSAAEYPPLGTPLSREDVARLKAQAEAMSEAPKLDNHQVCRRWNCTDEDCPHLHSLRHVEPRTGPCENDGLEGRPLCRGCPGQHTPFQEEWIAGHQAARLAGERLCHFRPCGDFTPGHRDRYKHIAGQFGGRPCRYDGSGETRWCVDPQCTFLHSPAQEDYRRRRGEKERMCRYGRCIVADPAHSEEFGHVEGQRVDRASVVCRHDGDCILHRRKLCGFAHPVSDGAGASASTSTQKKPRARW
jgi:hypothetical protein